LQVLTNSIGSLRKPQIENIKEFLSKEVVGNKCYAIDGFILLNDRNNVIINKKKQKESASIELKIGYTYEFDNYVYKVNQNSENIKISRNRDDELIDLETIKNKKLILRYWSAGDRFKPLGMNGTQKISDYLINNKIDLFKKEHQTVITADNKIIWLCGQRIDDSVKINKSTKNILRISRKLKITE
jgi:tRNA(Ile)-lysidine synthase